MPHDPQPDQPTPESPQPSDPAPGPAPQESPVPDVIPEDPGPSPFDAERLWSEDNGNAGRTLVSPKSSPSERFEESRMATRLF